MLASEAELKPEKPTVLVVEDEVLIRLQIADELRNRGIQVLEACNAEEALTILESSFAVHVLFTDIHMPGRMDGVGLTRLARQRYPELKLVLSSGHQPQQYARDSADVFIHKPYDPGAVVRQVEALLAECGHKLPDN
jgi:CheY-like chemotaxis protein